MRLFIACVLMSMVQATALAAAPPKLAVLGADKAVWADLLAGSERGQGSDACRTPATGSGA